MYFLLPKDRLILVQSLTRALCGDAHISLEGDLSRCITNLRVIRDASAHPTATLRMNTLSAARHDFVVLPLEVDTLDAITTRILPRIGLAQHVWHIQIEQHGVLQFASYDSFESVALSDSMPEELLLELMQQHALRGYSRDGRLREQVNRQ